MNKVKLYLIIILIFTLITLLFTFPVITKMNKFIYGPVYGTDYRGSIRHCWWVSYAFDHHLNWHVDNMVNYPFGEVHNWSIISPLWQLSGYALTILFNEQVAFNFMFIMSFILSAITMFALVFFITKDYRSSFLGGLIYSFCPYHFNKIWEHLGLGLIEWMPLYVLCLLRLRKHGKFVDIIICAFAFSLVILSDYYYAYLIAIFTLGFILFLFFYQWRLKSHSIIKRNWSDSRKWLKCDYLIFKRVIMVILFTFVLTLPATYSIFKMMIFVPKTQGVIPQEFVRPFHYLFSQSARPLSYILPASDHPIFGKFTKFMFGTIFYGRGSIEQTLYLGWAPLILAFVAYRNWRRNSHKLQSTNYMPRENFYIGFFIFMVIFAFLFSMPPYFNLGIFKIYFPSFFMYKILPMFRAYARFGVLVMLCVSVLAGFGLKYILERIRTPKKRFAFTALITCLILFEFNNIPPFRVTDISNSPAIYKWFAKEKGDFAIAEYPLGEAGIGETYINLDYLFYQRIHQKKIINGAIPGTYAYKIKEKVKKITDLQTPGILKWLGAKYVIVHLDKYKTVEDSEAMDILGEIPDLSKQKELKLIKKFDDVEVYEVMAYPIEPKVD